MVLLSLKKYTFKSGIHTKTTMQSQKTLNHIPKTIMEQHLRGSVRYGASVSPGYLKKDNTWIQEFDN